MKTTPIAINLEEASTQALKLRAKQFYNEVLHGTVSKE
jgi:hypothetical protein